MNWVKDKLIWITFCIGGGWALRFANDNMTYPWNHIFQDGLILCCVMIGFWHRKILGMIIALVSALLLLLIEVYSPPQLYNLFRAALIFAFLVYLFFRVRKVARTQNQIQ